MRYEMVSLCPVTHYCRGVEKGGGRVRQVATSTFELFKVEGALPFQLYNDQVDGSTCIFLSYQL